MHPKYSWHNKFTLCILNTHINNTRPPEDLSPIVTFRDPNVSRVIYDSKTNLCCDSE